MIKGSKPWLLLCFLVLINVANGLLLAILTPMWLGADEYAHYGYIQHLRVKGTLPDQRTCRFSQEIEASVYEADYGPIPSVEEETPAYGSLEDLRARIRALTREMREKAARLEFERAAEIRDELKELQKAELELA